MKKALMIGMLMVVCSTAFAQMDNPGCSLDVTQKDSNCGLNTNCANVLSCPTASFSVTAGCPTNLWIKAWTACLGSNCPPCQHCASCVSIYTSGGAFVVSLNTELECDENGGGTCCDVIQHTFAPGNYVMHVCLVPCNDIDGETCCTAGYPFAAFGRVSQSTLSCP